MDLKASLKAVFADGGFDVDAFVALIGEVVKAILNYVINTEYPAEEA